MADAQRATEQIRTVLAGGAESLAGGRRPARVVLRRSRAE